VAFSSSSRDRQQSSMQCSTLRQLEACSVSDSGRRHTRVRASPLFALSLPDLSFSSPLANNAAWGAVWRAQKMTW
jgi:hypothetical protein